MSDYVVNSATTRCNCGSNPAPFLPTPRIHGGISMGQNRISTEYDSTPANIMGNYGPCKKLGNKPCVKAFVGRWRNVSYRNYYNAFTFAYSRFLVAIRAADEAVALFGEWVLASATFEARNVTSKKREVQRALARIGGYQIPQKTVASCQAEYNKVKERYDLIHQLNSQIISPFRSKANKAKDEAFISDVLAKVNAAKLALNTLRMASFRNEAYLLLCSHLICGNGGVITVETPGQDLELEVEEEKKWDYFYLGEDRQEDLNE